MSDEMVEKARKIKRKRKGWVIVTGKRQDLLYSPEIYDWNYFYQSRRWVDDLAKIHEKHAGQWHGVRRATLEWEVE